MDHYVDGARHEEVKAYIGWTKDFSLVIFSGI